MKKKPFDEIGLQLKEPSLEFLSNREVTIEGMGGVLSYSEELIKVNLRKFSVGISGRGLSLKCISDTSLMISGFITNVSFYT